VVNGYYQPIAARRFSASDRQGSRLAEMKWRMIIYVDFREIINNKRRKSSR